MAACYSLKHSNTLLASYMLTSAKVDRVTLCQWSTCGLKSMCTHACAAQVWALSIANRSWTQLVASGPAPSPRYGAGGGIYPGVQSAPGPFTMQHKTFVLQPHFHHAQYLLSAPGNVAMHAGSHFSAAMHFQTALSCWSHTDLGRSVNSGQKIILLGGRACVYARESALAATATRPHIVKSRRASTADSIYSLYLIFNPV